MEHCISECKGCRLLGWDDEAIIYFCNHPYFNDSDIPTNNIEHTSARNLLSTIYTPTTPDWCPLKTEPLTIIFSPNKTT